MSEEGFSQKSEGHMKTACQKLLPLLLLLVLPAKMQAQFICATNHGTITITGYTGADAVVVIPSTTNGLPVTSLGNKAFGDCSNLTSVTIPNSVTNIGKGTFYFCTNLANI